MRGRILSVLAALAAAVSLHAQSQKGFVVIQNSGRDALPQTQIVVSQATPAVSDLNGKFVIQLPNHSVGQQLLVQSIDCPGYVLVNRKMVDQWVYAPTKEYRVDMCREEEYIANVERLYEIGSGYYENKYRQTLDELKRQKEQGALAEDEFGRKRKEANDELAKAYELLDTYAPLMASVNLDYLDENEAEIQRLIAQGHIDEAIEAYELMNLEDRYLVAVTVREQWTQDLEDMIPVLERYANSLMFAAGEENYAKAGNVLKVIADSSPKNPYRNEAYAHFALLQKMSDESIKYYNIALETIQDPYKEAEFCLFQADNYDKLYNYSESMNWAQKAIAVMETLPQDNTYTAFLTVKSLIFISTVLIGSQEYGEAVRNLKQADVILVALEEAGYGDNESMAICLRNMMTAYQNLGDTKNVRKVSERLKALEGLSGEEDAAALNKAMEFQTYALKGNYKEAIPVSSEVIALFRELYRSNPGKYRESLVQAILNHAICYYSLDKYQEAEPFYQECIALINEAPESISVSMIFQACSSYNMNLAMQRKFAEMLKCFEILKPYLDNIELTALQNEDMMIFWSYMLTASYAMGYYDWHIPYLGDISLVLDQNLDNAEYYPQVSQLCFYLALAHFQIADYELAEEHWRKFYNLAEKNNNRRYLNLHKLNSAIWTNRRMKPDESLRILSEINFKKLDLDYRPSYFFARATAYCLKKDFDKALEDIYESMEYGLEGQEHARALLYKIAMLDDVDSKWYGEYEESLKSVKSVYPVEYALAMCDLYMIKSRNAELLENYEDALNNMLEAVDVVMKVYDVNTVRYLTILVSYIFHDTARIAGKTNLGINVDDLLRLSRELFETGYSEKVSITTTYPMIFCDIWGGDMAAFYKSMISE